MEIPSIKLSNTKLPKSLDMPSVDLKQPTAEMPVFPTIVIPPRNLEAPKGVQIEDIPSETEEEETQTMEQPSLRIPLIKID